MIPGLWFELEMCGESAVTFGWLDQLLQRDGLPITNGCRRFWDMNNPEVVSYLEKRVIGLLKENGFGYIKIDYNETIGIGCENPDSLGEACAARLRARSVSSARSGARFPTWSLKTVPQAGTGWCPASWKSPA